MATIGALVVSLLASPLYPAYAAASYQGMKLDQKATALEYARILRSCMTAGGVNPETNEGYVKQGRLVYNTEATWLRPTVQSWNPTVVGGSSSIKDDNEIQCVENDVEIVKAAMSFFQIDPIEFVCELGAKRASGAENCVKGSGDFSRWSTSTDAVDAAINKFTGLDYNNPGDAVRYAQSYYVVMNGCVGSSLTKAEYDKENAENRYLIKQYPPGEAYYGSKSRTDQKPRGTNGDERGDTTCGTYLDNITNKYFDAYAKYIKAHPDEKLGGSPQQNQKCSDGSTPAADGKCPDGTTVTPPSGDSAGSSCAVPDVGWLVCPAVNFLTNVADNMYAFLAGNFLEVQSTLFVDPNGNVSPTYSAWRAMQAIANVAFVIAFLIIVFSHLSSVGVNNYGIKKMLPRLIVAAVLVNVSYIICQLAIDLSNLFGYGLRSLFTNVIQIPDVVKYGDDASKGTGAFGLAGAATTILAAGAGIYLALPFLGGAALVVVVILLTIGFLLIARKSILVLLVVIAPLAFVAYLLPNTEQWFTKWRKMFVGLLLVFPIIGLLFGAGNLASRVLMTAAGDDKLLQITAALAAVIPLIAVWGVLKGSLNAAGAIGNKINGLGGKLQGKANAAGRKGWDNSRFGQSRAMRKQRRATNRALAQSGAYSGRNPLRKLQSATNRAYNNSALSGRSGNLLAARGVALAGKEEDEELNAEVARQSAGVDPRDMIDVATKNLRQAAEKGDVVAARAAQKILLSSGAKGLEALHDTLERSESRGKLEGEVSRKLRSDIQAANLKGRDNGLDVWSRSSTTLEAAGGDAGTYSGLTPTELAGQTIESLERADMAGGISAAQARATLDNESAAAALSADKRTLLENIANGTSFGSMVRNGVPSTGLGAPGASGTPGGASSSGVASSSDELSVPHSSAAQAAAASTSSPVDDDFRQGIADAASSLNASPSGRPAPPAAPATPRAAGPTDADREYYGGDGRRD